MKRKRKCNHLPRIEGEEVYCMKCKIKLGKIVYAKLIGVKK